MAAKMIDDLHMGLECILGSDRSREGEEHSRRIARSKLLHRPGQNFEGPRARAQKETTYHMSKY